MAGTSAASEAGSPSQMDTENSSASPSIIHNADTCCNFPRVSTNTDAILPYLYCNSCDRYLGFEEPLSGTPEYEARKANLLTPVHVPSTPTFMPPTPTSPQLEQPDDCVLMPPPSPPKRRRVSNTPAHVPNPSFTPRMSPMQSSPSRRARSHVRLGGGGRGRGIKSIAWSTLPPPQPRRPPPQPPKSINWSLPAPNIHDGHAPYASVAPMEPPPPTMPAGAATYRPMPVRYGPYFVPAPGYNMPTSYRIDGTGMVIPMQTSSGGGVGGGFNRTGYTPEHVTLTTSNSSNGTHFRPPPQSQGHPNFRNPWDKEAMAQQQQQAEVAFGHMPLATPPTMSTSYLSPPQNHASLPPQNHASLPPQAELEGLISPPPPPQTQATPSPRPHATTPRMINNLTTPLACPCGVPARLTVVDTSRRGVGPEIEVWVCGVGRCGFYVRA